MDTQDPTSPPLRKAYSYVRFSTPEQAKGDSADRQLRMARAYAALHALDLDDSLSFHDLGISGFRGANAAEGKLAYFVEAVKTGLVPQGAVLLVEQLDRISRLTPLKALDVLRAITGAGVSVVTLNDGREYSESSLETQPMDAMMSMMMFMRANEESATKASRLSASWSAKRAKAATVPMTSVVPAWLQLDKAAGKIVVIPERGALVKRMFDMTLEGAGQHSIAAALNRDRVKPWGRGAFWHRSYVSKILANPAVIGSFAPHVVEYEGAKKAKRALPTVNGYYPAVVSDELYAEVQALHSSRSASRGRHAAQPINNVLAGLARCALCGQTMTRTNKGRRSQPAYVCAAAKAGAGCTYRSVRCAWVELAIVERLPERLGVLPAAEAEACLEQEVVNAEAWLDELRGMGRDLMDPDNAAPSGGRGSALAKVEVAIREVEARLAELIERLEISSGPLIAARVEVLRASLASEERDAATINLAMRKVFKDVTIHPEHRILQFSYIHGGDCVLGY